MVLLDKPERNRFTTRERHGHWQRVSQDVQGGLTAHDRKYKTSSLAVIRCAMFITCQKDMDFGVEHNTATDVRLLFWHVASHEFQKMSYPLHAGHQFPGRRLN